MLLVLYLGVCGGAGLGIAVPRCCAAGPRCCATPGVTTAPRGAVGKALSAQGREQGLGGLGTCPSQQRGRGKGFPCCPWSGPAPALGPVFTACFGVAQTLPGLQRDRQLASPSSLCGLHGSCGVREPRAPGHPLCGGRCEALLLSGADGGGGGHPISAGTRDSACRDLCPMGTVGWAQHWDPASHQHPASHQVLGAPMAVPSWWRCPSDPSEPPPPRW